MEKAVKLGNSISSLLALKGADVLEDADTFVGLLSDFLGSDTDIIDVIAKGYNQTSAKFIKSALESSGSDKTKYLELFEKYLAQSTSLNSTDISFMMKGFSNGLGIDGFVDGKEHESNGLAALEKGDYDLAYAIFSKLEENGHITGAKYKGYCLIHGLGCQESHEKGMQLILNCTDGSVLSYLEMADFVGEGKNDELFLKAASAADIDSFNVILSAADKCEKNGKKELASLMRKIVADKDFPPAMYSYAKGLWDDGTIEEKKLALSYYEKAAAMGSCDAWYELGVIYDSKYADVNEPRDLARAFTCYQEAAKNGDGKAWYKLHTFYHSGEVVPADVRKEIECLYKSAEAGYGQAWATLGYIYHIGENVDINIPKAIEYYTRAINEGCNGILDNLLNLLVYDDSAYTNVIAAEKILKSEAEKGNSEAIYRLAELYYDGPDAVRDLNKAIRFYDEAIKRGSLRGLYDLGMIYRLDVPNGETKAEKLLLEASNHDDIDAMLQLAFLYFDNETKVFNRQKGKYWAQKVLNRSSELNEYSAESRNKIVSRLQFELSR